MGQLFLLKEAMTAMAQKVYHLYSLRQEEVAEADVDVMMSLLRAMERRAGGKVEKSIAKHPNIVQGASPWDVGSWTAEVKEGIKNRVVTR